MSRDALDKVLDALGSLSDDAQRYRVLHAASSFYDLPLVAEISLGDPDEEDPS